MATFRSQCSSSSMLLSTSVCQSHRDTLPHVGNQIDPPCNVPSDVLRTHPAQRAVTTLHLHSSDVYTSHTCSNEDSQNEQRADDRKNRTQYEKYYAERSTHCFPALLYVCLSVSLCVVCPRKK